MPIEISSSGGLYNVFVDDAVVAESILVNKSSIFIIDRKVWSLFRDSILRNIDVDRTIFIDALERNKEFERLASIYMNIIDLGARKNITLVAIGGGIVQDIVGFIAATLFRGVPWILFPTTLLAQADSCIGSKSSINLRGSKNQIGAFYQPSSVHILTDFLQTLDEKMIKSGLGEIAKLSIIDGEERWSAFKQILPTLLQRKQDVIKKWIIIALNIKKLFIEEDEFDKGIRNYLNYGHCFGHAIESSTSNKIPHGQAVSLGVIMADFLAVKRGILSEVIATDRRLVLETIVDWEIKKLRLRQDKMLLAMSKDKKRTGSGFAVIISNSEWNMVKLDNVTKEEIVNVIKFPY